MILTNTQAQAVYTAASALSTVGGKLSISFTAARWTRVTVDQEMGGLVRVTRQSSTGTPTQEQYSTIDGLAAAYGVQSQA